MIFQLVGTLAFALAAPLGALAYFRRYRLPRPAVGAFNGRDVVVMMAFVAVLPYAFLALPGRGLPIVFGLFLLGLLVVGYEPVIPNRWARWAAVLALLGTDVVAASSGVDLLWYSLANSAVILVAVVAASNLSAQGGLHLSHVAAFGLALAAYDAFFATVVPLTQRLADATNGEAFAPVARLQVGSLGAAIGMGDLLVYSLFTVVAYKAYGRTGLSVALALIATVGSVVPTLTLWGVYRLTGTMPSLIPAQVYFGPACFVAYLVLRRRKGPERRMVDLRRPLTPIVV